MGLLRRVGFGAYSLDLEIFAYLRTSDWNEFLQIREDIYLRMMDVVAEAGTGFALPSQTTYLGEDTALDAERTREAAARVAAWCEEGVLPFPEFPVEHRRRIDGSLDWPLEGSPGGRQRTGEGMHLGEWTSRRPPFVVIGAMVSVGNDVVAESARDPQRAPHLLVQRSG